MGQRLQLHQLLETFTEHVYFQPPTNIKLEYPCIIYKRDFANTKFADDKPYDHTLRYMIMMMRRSVIGMTSMRRCWARSFQRAIQVERASSDCCVMLPNFLRAAAGASCSDMPSATSSSAIDSMWNCISSHSKRCLSL